MFSCFIQWFTSIMVASYSKNLGFKPVFTVNLSTSNAWAICGTSLLHFSVSLAIALIKISFFSFLIVLYLFVKSSTSLLIFSICCSEVSATSFRLATNIASVRISAISSIVLSFSLVSHIVSAFLMLLHPSPNQKSLYFHIQQNSRL